MGGSGMFDLPTAPHNMRLHLSLSGLVWAGWGMGMPCTGIGYDLPSNSVHTAADTPESLGSRVSRLGDRGAWQGGQECTDVDYPPTRAAATPESLRSCRGLLGDADAPPWGDWV